MVKLLPKNEAHIALVLAAKAGHAPVVRLLLENGHWPSATQALIHAAGTGKAETVRLLLQAGANVNALRLGYDNETSLHRALRRPENEEVVKMLIESGADVEAQDSMGETALAKAVWTGRVAESWLLLKRGADPNAVEAKGNPSLTYIYTADSQTALELVLLAQRTWKGKETGLDQNATNLDSNVYPLSDSMQEPI